MTTRFQEFPKSENRRGWQRRRVTDQDPAGPETTTKERLRRARKEFPNGQGRGAFTNRADGCKRNGCKFAHTCKTCGKRSRRPQPPLQPLGDSSDPVSRLGQPTLIAWI
jgi:hypothetical protein